MLTKSVKKNVFRHRKQTATAFVLILLLSMTAFMMNTPAMEPLEIPTFALLSIAPNPVGLNQVAYVNAFMSKPTPTAGMASSGDQYENITIYITRPDGEAETIGPLRSDSTGGTWASYKPDQLGTYTFKMVYPGQTLQVEPTWNGSVLLPSESETVDLVVQEDPIQSIYNSPPLPTDYWSRPIYTTNYDWGQVGGNWLGLRAPSFATTGMYDATGNFQPYSEAPNTGHIVWTKPTHFGGQVGLPISSDQESPYTATSIAINYFEPIIINGILYYTQYAGLTSEKVSWEAVDLRTGQNLWSRTPGETGDEVIRMGQVLRFHTVQEFGSVAYLWGTESAGFFQTPSFFSLYDAMTGAFIANITDIQNPSFITDVSGQQQGTLLGWSVNRGNLTMWNSTLMLTAGAQMFGTVVTIRPSGTYNYTDGIQWSVSLPTTLNGEPLGGSMSIAATTPEVIMVRYAPTAAMFSELNRGYQITAGFDAKTGELLWGPINQTLPTLEDTAILCARDGVYVLHNKDRDEAYGYSLTTGQLKWGPIKLNGNAWSSISRAADIAYDKVYIWDFGGYVNALDLETGSIEWTYTPRTSGYDAPYGIYPMWHFGTHSIADGKLFLSEGSMYNPPIHPAYRLAINCSDGSLVWSILSYSGRCPAAIADGYIVEWNCFDCQIYTFGKGPTATTVTASPKISPIDQQVLIEGTVMDKSPGTADLDVQAKFPFGVPAIADEYMSAWMEHVYMQQLKPANATGVEVYLTAFDPNGNLQEIGTAVSDELGNYAIEWEPPVPGVYTVRAEFKGTESYYSSEAGTTFVVSENQAAPVPLVTPTAASPTQTPPPQSSPTHLASTSPSPSVAPPPTSEMPTSTYIAIGIAAVIVIVAAAGLILRKRS